MSVSLFRLLCAGMFSLALVFSATAKQPSLAASVPAEGAIAFVELANPGEIVGRMRNSKVLEWALATDEYCKFEESAEYRRFKAARATAEAVLGSSLWDAAAELLSGRIGVALYAGSGTGAKPQAVVVLHLDESKTLERGRDVVKPLLSGWGKEENTGELFPGSTTWSVQNAGFLTLHGKWIVASQDKSLLDRTLALIGGAERNKAGAALAAQSRFAEMERGLGDEHHARAWVDTEALKKALGEKLTLPAKLPDGMASLIFGGLLKLADQSPYAAATLDVRKDGVEGLLAIAGEPAKLAAPAELWYTQYPDNGVIPLPKTPGAIGGFTMHRKLGTWYRLRDQLLADHLLPAFDKFETDIGNLLPQKDFGQDVMPLIGDNFTFVSALQNYEHLDGKPGIKLPAFAAIFDLPKPQEGTDTFQLFFQTLGAILNLQAGQESRQPSVMDTEVYHDTKITWSRYLSKPKGERLAVAYNFQPAAAAVGRKYILATSVQLCRDLIDHFKNPEASRWQNRNAELVLDFATLAKLAEENEGALRSQQIEKGTPNETAGQRVGMLVNLLKQMDTLRYYSGPDGGMFKMHLRVGWK